MNQTVTLSGTSLSLCPETLQISVEVAGASWGFCPGFSPKVVTKKGEHLFLSAGQISHHPWKTGVGEGLRSTFSGFAGTALSFETIVWIEGVTGHVYFEFVPLTDCEEELEAVYWPGALEFDQADPSWYSVLNVLQGILLPNTWEHPVNKEENPLNFGGQYGSTAAYMPWFGQVRPGSGYMAICETPWDGAYEVDHPAGGSYSHIIPRWVESMGHIRYKRVYQYRFFGDCDYNTLCKEYRQYAKETGLLTTLKEKAARCGYVDKLIGSAIVHTGIKNHCSPESRYYDAEHPELMDHVTPFQTREEQIKKLKAAGLKKVYLHLDGWGDPGYDNKHPDYLPACIEAGGWTDMKSLSDTMKDCGYMFGVHDQYRDYYFDAPTFDKDFACREPSGEIHEHTIWAGGHQTYLCASQAPYYVKRNFEELFRQGIHLEATYLDVFTCNEGDECTHPWHWMTRKDCFEFRKRCFDYLLSKDILPSSEEVVDWAMQSLVFAHYGPYDHMLHTKTPPKGIPTPLFNLVYHDCVILPWMMDQKPGEDYMLYALLNGGGAYLNMELEGDALKTEIARYETVSQLQEKVAKCEMVSHHFSNGYKQETARYCNGITVTINHETQSYQIHEEEAK